MVGRRCRFNPVRIKSHFFIFPSGIRLVPSTRAIRLYRDTDLIDGLDKQLDPVRCDYHAALLARQPRWPARQPVSIKDAYCRDASGCTRFRNLWIIACGYVYLVRPAVCSLLSL